MHTIKLQSSEGEIFVANLRAAKRMLVIKNMLNVLGIEGDTQDTIVPIYAVDSKTLKLIVDFCHRHIDDRELTSGEKGPFPFIFDIDHEIVRELSVSEIFALIRAIEYLEVPDFQEVACRAVANLIIGKTPEEIRRVFNIKNDFTPEEEAALRRENAMRLRIMELEENLLADLNRQH